MITRADRTNEIPPETLEHRDEDRYVSPSYLARMWGVHINTVYREIRKGALPHTRIGGQLRVRWLDVRRYGRPAD